MTEELELRLVKEFPTFFRDYKGDPMATCMAWGIEHQDGWFDLFYELNQKIAAHLSTLESKPDFKWAQVKEKFGTARWYYDGGDDIISDLVSEYENRTGQTCEVCGKPGKTNGRGWLKTTCEEHK